MGKIGHVTSPLHYGKAPKWLFERMKSLARYIIIAMREEFSEDIILEKLSDPYWFQCLGCVLGFDWHSSGLGTTVCGALKEGIKGYEKEIGIFIAGGKGKVSRRTPEEITFWCEKTGISGDKLIYSSRMSAKVDSSAIQDGYKLYHHSFFFTAKGKWAVIQQGMNEENKMARRYHWLGDKVESFVCQPHSGIAADRIEQKILNLVDRESEECRKASVSIANTEPSKILKEFYGSKFLLLPSRHEIRSEDIDSKKIHKILLSTYEQAPENFEELLAIRGVGEKSLRALALLSELLYGKPPSFNDPARFSFAHGGKDGTPYPVDRRTYDFSIEVLKRAIEMSKLGNREKIESIKKLAYFYNF